MSGYYLFSTAGCHLCEQAERLLEQSAIADAYQKKDIADTPEWLERYGIRIPVLYHLSSGQELSWPFDESTLQRFIAEHP
ncbi:glutaredoxin family protein [Methylomarinum vadi]|uniref:glutaredoxin family protein n=1 Tax=Methylomarinum vadi TaxID=438855 RepID=UPI0004DED4B4|nr:glutaredoxin family protein [Methylomarinum vadi]